jgi:branched-subunit amino acid transport protein
MLNIIKSKEFKTSLFLALIGLVASALAVLYQMPLLSEDMKQEIITQVGSIEVMVLIAMVQGAILTFIAAFIGLKLAGKVNLKVNFKYDKQAMILSVLIAFIVALIIVGSDRFIFAQYMPNTSAGYNFSFMYLAVGLLYGGVIEEVLVRLFLMSLFVWAFKLLLARHNDMGNIPAWIYWIAIFLAAALFAALHLPVTLQTIGNSFPIILRCMVLNGIGGIGFGYLYWKKGLSYSIVAHASTHVFMQVILMLIFL